MGITLTEYWAQNGHCRSAISTSVAGAPDFPSRMPFCGIPSYSGATSSACVIPGRDVGGAAVSSLPLLDITMATTTTTVASTGRRASWRLRAMRAR